LVHRNPNNIEEIMKVFKTVLLLLVLATANTFAQSSVYNDWEKKFYVDEFQDPTEESYRSEIFSGAFSNTATTNSTCLYKIVVTHDSWEINVWEYGSHKARFDSAYSTFKIKTPSGEVYTLKAFFFSNSVSITNEGGTKKSFKDINDIISVKGEYMVVFSEGKYSKSSYKFKFIL